ncbi:PIG-L deacetylase family protein [Micromonospora sp. CPCC 206061]|uniref:PIG-L deacetylase family protein n=1 Tax=Micromonospora sp. CPCC 206061 TaxID=3122410 RepID=UPI002FEF138D
MARVLIVAPHPDDEVLGCGGSIAMHAEAGHEVAIAFLTSGEHGGSAEADDLGTRREREAVDAAAALGVRSDRLRFLRFPDGGIDPYDCDQFGVVLEVLRESRPDLLYLPHPKDGSFDHEAAFALCWRAAQMAGSSNYPQCGSPHWVSTILGYEVWTPITQPALLRDIAPVVERKLAALGRYRTQTVGAKGAGQSTLVGPACMHLTGFRGASTTGGHREAFTVLRLREVIV